MISIKRVYEPPAASDGYRVLVDRLWPRGLSKEKAGIDEWLREIAPSNELRKWIHHDPERWDEFIERYRKELAEPERAEQLAHLRRLAKAKRKVTLLYATKDEDRNNAVALARLLG